MYFLDLSNNQIKGINSLQNLTFLKYLFLSQNQINQIDSLKNLKSLEDLNLSNNQIKEIDSIENMKSLISLELSNNQITSIDSLKNMRSLERLFLSNNQIKEINSLKSVINFWYLDLSNNKIKEIDSLNKFKCFLFLFNNPIENLTLNINSHNKMQIYLSSTSSYNLSALNDWINQYNQIYIFDDLKNVNTSNIFNQKHHSISNELNKYYKSANLIQLNNIFDSDCRLTIDYLKRRIHFNLFLNEQIDLFFAKCQQFEFDF